MSSAVNSDNLSGGNLQNWSTHPGGPPHHDIPDPHPMPPHGVPPHPYGPALGDGPASGVGGGEGSIGQNSFVAREYSYAAMLGGKWSR